MRDIRDASFYENYVLPKVYYKQYYSIEAAIHHRVVRVRSKEARRNRAPPPRFRAQREDGAPRQGGPPGSKPATAAPGGAGAPGAPPAGAPPAPPACLSSFASAGICREYLRSWSLFCQDPVASVALPSLSMTLLVPIGSIKWRVNP